MGSKPCQKKEINKKLHDLTDFLRVISDENRLRILCILKKSPKCVTDIWEGLDLNQNLVSHHLKSLKDFKLIICEKKGLKIFYRLDKKNINKYYKSLEKFFEKYDY